MTTTSRQTPRSPRRNGTRAHTEGLRHIDLDVVNVVVIPDRLEQSVGESEGEDVLWRLFTEEVVNAENLLFGEYFMDRGVE